MSANTIVPFLCRGASNAGRRALFIVSREVTPPAALTRYPMGSPRRTPKGRADQLMFTALELT